MCKVFSKNRRVVLFSFCRLILYVEKRHIVSCKYDFWKKIKNTFHLTNFNFQKMHKKFSATKVLW